MLATIEQPLDLIKLSIDKEIKVKLRNDRELTGRLHAYDPHLNMIMGQVKEIHTTLEIDEDTDEKVYKEREKEIPLIFVRGDGIILITPIGVL